MRIVDEEIIANAQNEEPKQEESITEQQMTFRQKVEHFWEYEKWKVIIPIVLLIVMNSFIQTYKSERQPLTLDIAMVNAVMESADDVDFHNGFIEEYDIDVEKAPIKIETGMVHPKVMDEKAATDELTVASIQKYQAMLTSGKIDITVSNEWAVEEYGKTDSYENLQELLPEDVYHRIEGKLFYHTNEVGEKVPIGIIVDEIESINQFYNDTPIVTVSKHSTRKEQSVLFIKWLTKSIK